MNLRLLYHSLDIFAILPITNFTHTHTHTPYIYIHMYQVHVDEGSNVVSNRFSPIFPSEHTHARAHTHTHTYIYIYIYIIVQFFVAGSKREKIF